MVYFRIVICLVVGFAFHEKVPARQPATNLLIDEALSRVYNFDFDGSHEIVNRHIENHPSDSLGYALRSAVCLFSELDRLGILESEFFLDDGRRLEKQKLEPDPRLKMMLMMAAEDARRYALAQLERRRNDPYALFALSVAGGMLADYTALVQKRRLRSLAHAKKSHAYALRLLQHDPTFYDAYLTTGLSEYLVSNLPFFVRWFVRFKEVRGSKEQAIRNLRLVATSGRYFGPLARILLVVIHLREKQFQEAEKLLLPLVTQFPENPLFQRELAVLSRKLGPLSIQNNAVASRTATNSRRSEVR